MVSPDEDSGLTHSASLRNEPTPTRSSRPHLYNIWEYRDFFSSRLHKHDSNLENILLTYQFGKQCFQFGI